jgi:isocitrate/isopropylmalate dehydrogenase
MRAACLVLDAATGGGINWIDLDAGEGCYKRTDVPLPEETVSQLRQIGLGLKSPLTTPSGGGFRSVNVSLRERLHLYAGVRRVRTLPGVQSPFQDVDITTFRHNIGDLYGADETVSGHVGNRQVRLATHFHEASFLKLCRRAFAWAAQHGKTRVTVALKDNILKLSGRVYREAFESIAAQYPSIKADLIKVDAICMMLVQNPQQFQVIAAPNLFGDILSDLTAGLVGGLGVAPGGNIGDNCAIFEAVHGTAPNIAGMGVANPTALMLSGTELLTHAGLIEEADRVSRALLQALRAGDRTRDLGGTLNTHEFTQAVLQHL